ncbi:MAG: hypothetical protein OXF74_01920 [Rhodobacteraceae bacterium]|nr:hypothetical protein [Paracoccaceae bacterium]
MPEGDPAASSRPPLTQIQIEAESFPPGGGGGPFRECVPFDPDFTDMFRKYVKRPELAGAEFAEEFPKSGLYLSLTGIEADFIRDRNHIIRADTAAELRNKISRVRLRLACRNTSERDTVESAMRWKTPLYHRVGREMVQQSKFGESQFGIRFL